MFTLTVEKLEHFPGHGTILTGTMESGHVAQGDAIYLCSPAHRVKGDIASIELFPGGFAVRAAQGQRATLLVRNLDIDRVSDGFHRDGSNIRPSGLTVCERGGPMQRALGLLKRG